MSAGRDPRVDPKPGDVVGLGDTHYKVIACPGDAVQYAIDGPGVPLRIRTDHVFYWQLGHIESRVVARGQEDRDGG